MDKNYFWIWSLVIITCLGFGIWVLGFWLGGCATSQQEIISTTTTTAGGTTTSTTSPVVSGSISGTVSWEWSGYNTSDKWGKLFVFLWTDEDFGNRDLMSANKQFDISSGQTSADYNFVSPASGIYYLFSMLYVGRSADLFGDPEAGDKIGQYSNGEMPISFGGTTHAQGIPYTGTAVTGNNFSLNATWTTTTPPTTNTSLPTVDPNWQDIGGVTMSGTASDAWVSDLVFDNSGDLYAGGRFDSAGGVPANNIAKWNHTTSSWEALAGGLNGPVEGVIFDPVSGSIYAGGVFTSANNIAKWDIGSETWSPLGSGISGSGSQVLTVAVDSSGEVYAGGNFDYAGGVTVKNIAEWKTASSSWDAMGGGLFTPVFSSQVFDMVFGSDGNLYAGGSFTTTETVAISSVAKWNVTFSSWEALPGGSGGVMALAADNLGAIYATAGMVIQKWTGSTWVNLPASDGDSPLHSLAVKSPTEIYANRYAYGRISKWNGSSWNNLSGEITNAPGTVIVRVLKPGPDGNLYVGGRFTCAGGHSAANIAKRINP